jgi:uncharacterized repeat protein (TIGR01451 family)
LRILKTFLCLCLLLPLPVWGEQSFAITFDGWTDFNGNGLIDCSEPVTFRIGLSQFDAPVGPETGTITVPFNTSTRWRFTPGSFRQDFILLDSCTLSLLQGNDPNDTAAVVRYSCDASGGNPLDHNYAFQFFVTGIYLGGSVGPIIVDAENDRDFPTAGSLHDVTASAGPLNPCLPPPDLRLTKTVLSGDGTPGSLLAYGLSVGNFGNGDATKVVLAETVPQLTSFDPANSSAGWTCAPDGNAGSSCTLSLGSLAVNASASRTFAVRVAASLPPGSPATIDNTACASSTPADDLPGNNCGSVSTPTGNPDLGVAKSVSSGNGNPGSVLVYQLVTSNSGSRDAAGVSLNESVPPLTTFLPGSSSPGWTCTPNNNAGSSCTLSLGTLAAGASATRTFAVQAASTFPANPPAIDNTACASTTTGGDPSGNNCGSTSTPPGGNPDVRMAKSVASGSGNPGSVLVYQLAASNAGTRDAAGVSLQETMPQLTTFLPGSSSPGWTCTPSNNAGSSCTLSLGTLAAGASATRTFAVQVASTFPANPPAIDNTACVSTTSSGDPSANDCGSTSTPPGGNPDVRMAKSVASGNGNPGSVLVYQLVASNAGTRDAAAVSLQETVPQLTSFLPGSSSPGWTCTPNNSAGSSCTLSLGTLAAGASATYTFAVQVASTLPANPPAIDNTACVSTTSSGDPSGDDCGSTSTPPGGNPDVRMAKSVASGSGDPGGVLVYQLALSNAGTRDAAGVSVQETVPQLTTFLPGSSSPGWTCSPNNNAGSSCTLSVGTLAAGAAATYTFAVQVASTFPANPPAIDNTACVSTTSAGDPSGNNRGTTSTPPGGNSDLAMAKSVASGSGNPGSVLVYQLVVSNAGTRDAAGVSLRETVPQLTSFLAAGSSPGWTCSPDGNAGSSCTLAVGTVTAGSSATFTFAVQVASTFPADPPVIANTACASTTSNGDPSGNDCGTTSTPPGGNPDVRMAKSVASGNGNPGSVLVYQLLMTNAGTRNAVGVSLHETVPQLTIFRSAGSSPGWTCTPDGNAGSSCTLAVGTVAAGSSSTFTFAVQVASAFPPNPPAIDNTACVSTTSSGDPTDNDCGTTSTPPGGGPDLKLVKSVASGSATPGSVLVYELQVSNLGTQGAAGVSLEETVPQLTTFLPGSSSPGWTCTPGNNAGSSCALAVGTVPAGSSASFTFSVQVASTFPPNPPAIENSACVSTTSSGDPSGNDCGSTSTPPGGSPDLKLEKSVASGTANPGSVLVYSLKVSNIGTRGAADVKIKETVPQLTTFLPASSSPGWTCSPDGSAGSPCTLDVGTVAAGSSMTFTFAVQVASSFPPNPPAIENSACVSTSSSGDPEGNDCGSTSTPPGGRPDLVLQKSLASGTVVPNGVLVFTLALHNQGNADATGVVLQETVPQDSTFEAAGSAPGWSCTPDGNAGSHCTLPVGTVGAGASQSFAFAVRLRPDLPPGTSVSNTACVEQAEGAGDPPASNCPTVIVDPPGPSTLTDLELTLAVDDRKLPPGVPFVFTLTLRNASAVEARGIKVAVSLPSFGTQPTGLDPACRISDETLECSIPLLAGGGLVQLTWKQAAFQVGEHIVSAEVTEATPEDIDSTPGNGVKTEDDYAEVAVSVSANPGVHDIPTLSTVGISVMVLLLVTLAVVFLRRGSARTAV